MISRIARVMKARRNSLQEKEKGFTLIELLVVIVIIGILAAIAIPVYLNVQNNAKDAAVQSDLTNAKTAIISVQTTTGTLPASSADIGAVPPTGVVTTAEGYTQSVNTSKITYLVTGSSFCIAAKGVTTNNIFYVTDTSGVLKGGTTAASTLPSTCTPPV